MTRSLALGAWAVTFGLDAAALLAVAAVAATGAPQSAVLAGTLALAGLVVVTYRSGGRFEFEHDHARPLAPDEQPDLRDALLDVCERANRPPPRLLVAEMDAPGAMVGYASGRPVVAVDPLLPRVVGPDGVRALLAHELGHLGTDLHTDALRAYAPTVLGFGTFWLVALAGRGPLPATAGTALFVALALGADRRVRAVRYALGLGVEPLALAASRYANRLEEYRADAYAATLVAPATLADALYRVAAVATGDNMEDVAGPVPWNADRTLRFALFATHPSIENRVHRLGSEIPDWARRAATREDA